MHPCDITKLMKLFNSLVDSGNTVIIIEHNLDVIKQADWIIDIGPEGGKNGGKVVFQGTPQGNDYNFSVPYSKEYTGNDGVIREKINCS